MKSELAEELFEVIEARSPARPTPMEFEMAYQARVAIDRIRFAIKHTEQFVFERDRLLKAANEGNAICTRSARSDIAGALKQTNPRARVRSG